MVVTEEKLKELGFTSAASRISHNSKIYGKMAIAEEHYNYYTDFELSKYQSYLRKITKHMKGDYFTYDELRFYSLSDYPDVPPLKVLNKLEEAKKMGIFDSFSIGRIEERKERVVRYDPILVGLITGCNKSFLIDQWGEDVTLEAIQKAAKIKK